MTNMNCPDKVVVFLAHLCVGTFIHSVIYARGQRFDGQNGRYTISVYEIHAMLIVTLILS